jgi:hypothetical protein
MQVLEALRVPLDLASTKVEKLNVGSTNFDDCDMGTLNDAFQDGKARVFPNLRYLGLARRNTICT